MSFWTKVATKINDLNCFKASCAEHEIAYEENQDENFKVGGGKVIATLRDKKTRGHAFLIEKMGAVQLFIDTDASYNPMTGRLGANGGKLVRDYSRGVVEKNIKRSGGFITSTEELPDGSLCLRAAVM